MPIEFLLALQASGMVVDWLGKNEQVRLGKLGNQVEQAGINSNIATSRLDAEQGSLQAMKQLRMNLGTQAAVYAARGTQIGTGSSVLTANESIGNFNADERMRKLDQAGTEAGLRAGSTLSNLHQKTSENNIWNEFRQNAFNNFSTNSSDYYSKIGSIFGFTNVGGSNG